MKTIYQTLFFCILLCTSIYASAQVPVYNSNPTASGVIFLDFDGTTVQGTSWNTSGPIVCGPSNLPVEKITEVFDRVAEDYRPFNVNVTTDSTKYMSAPPTKRMRVVLTISSDWYGSAGGVAYTNSFTWGDNTPCFVFTALHNYNTKNISEAASHEAGHTLGLRHQSSYDEVCNKTSDYNTGTGSGEIGWAPIMGVGYYRNLTLWHYGANPYGCTAYQDDLAIITSSTNGIGYRVDDYTNVLSSATSVAFNNNQFAINGIIEKPNDIDAVKFNVATSGRFTLQALPFSIGSGNLGSDIDLEIQLLNNAQTVIGIYNPEATLNASIDTQLNAGTYYLRVQGKGNLYAPNYASLGSYNLKATIGTGTPLPLRVFQLKGSSENGHHNLAWEIIADEKVVSQTLEVSTNAVNFNNTTTVAASARNFTASPVTNGLVYYRLNIVFDNGQQYYSNTVALRNNGSNGKPYLVGNVTTGKLVVNSPSNFSYSIHDLTGRMLSKGNLIAGTNSIFTGGLTSGLYIIQYNNNSEDFTEKFMKQ